jgi:outer membrane protein
MIRRRATCLLAALLALAARADAQAPLTLTEAIARARTHNPDAGIGAAAERAAAQRVMLARAGYMPTVDVSESWERGNHPVFVFSSLLAQRRFTASDFALRALNHPEALDDFRSAVTVQQPLFDSATRSHVTAATIGHEIAIADRAAIDHDLVTSVTDAYARVLVAAGARRSADAVVETARADRDLAGNRRDAGRATDGDVLLVDVYVARAREQQLRAASDERIARARLNQVMGEPLGGVFDLDDAPVATAIDAGDVAALEANAIENRPDVARAALQQRLAAAGQAAARGAFLPQVSAQGGWEFNGGTWGTRQSSWMVAATARINVFHGFADKARLAAANEEAGQRALERERTITAARLDVRIAVTTLDTARASEVVGRAALAQAQESRRIVRDRYEAGLTDIASLLRATDAVVAAETQQITARAAVLTGTAALEKALGR